MNINVIGLGYIGLPTSLILASRGNNVVGTDLNGDLVNLLNKDQLTFEEKDLSVLFEQAKMNNIVFTTEYVNADVYIVTVPTPYDEHTHLIDSSYIEMAVAKICEVATRNVIIVIESTVSPGTIDAKIRPIIAKSSINIDLVHAPERILPGAMVSELVNNSRTIGADNAEVGEKIKNIYESFCEGEIIITSIKIAEMSKVVENTFRDINIAFANELAILCREAKIDVNEVIRVANKHPRVNILSPGPGVGGHCISVDPWFLVGDYPEHTRLIKQARNVNDEMPQYIKDRIDDIMQTEKVETYKEIGIYGLTYKENVDDTRNSPTLQLLNLFNGNDLPKVYDPHVKIGTVVNQVNNLDDLLDGIKVLIIMCNHRELSEIQLKKSVVVFDTKNTNLFQLNKVETL